MSYQSIGKVVRAFTLIELLVVISIIGILAALLLANFAGIRDRADDARLKSDLKQFQTALRTRYNDDQQYPGAALNTDYTCASVAGSGYIDAASIATSCRYIKRTADTFIACVPLANAADRDIAASQSKCAGLPTMAGLTAQNAFCVCSN